LYGAIPIVSSESELIDCLDQGDPIIAEGNNFHEAIIKASELFRDTRALLNKQAENMLQDFSWSSQKQKYIDLYEGLI
jgi:glycogen synthase